MLVLVFLNTVKKMTDNSLNIEKEALELCNKFWEAIWDDKNAKKTGKQIREELLKDVPSEVIEVFKKML